MFVSRAGVYCKWGMLKVLKILTSAFFYPLIQGLGAPGHWRLTPVPPPVETAPKSALDPVTYLGQTSVSGQMVAQGVWKNRIPPFIAILVLV